MSEQDLTPDQLEQLREQLASVITSPAATEAPGGRPGSEGPRPGGRGPANLACCRKS